jgi:DNA polymerase I-like protein with 3'-5' exonuclease and polymerase domains
LEDLLDQHPLPTIILEHRKINKIVSSFLEPLADLANKQPAGKADMIHVLCRPFLEP